MAVTKPNSGNALLDWLFISAAVVTVYNFGKKAVSVAEDYIRSNIKWRWYNVQLNLSTIPGSLLVTFDLEVINGNSYGITLSELRDCKLFYGTQEIGDITLPIGRIYEFTANQKVIIPISIDKPLADLGLSIVQMITTKIYLSTLMVTGYAVTTAGTFSIKQTINIDQKDNATGL